MSEKIATEQRFETTTVVDLEQDGTILVPAGSTVRGIVSAVDPAGKLDRRGSLTLAFDENCRQGPRISNEGNGVAGLRERRHP